MSGWRSSELWIKIKITSDTVLQDKPFSLAAPRLIDASALTAQDACVKCAHLQFSHERFDKHQQKCSTQTTGALD